MDVYYAANIAVAVARARSELHQPVTTVLPDTVSLASPLYFMRNRSYARNHAFLGPGNGEVILHERASLSWRRWVNEDR